MASMMKFIDIKHGMSRRVILIGNYAIKFPRIGNGQGMFLIGLLGNYVEADRYKLSKGYSAEKSLAKVVFSLPLGLCTVMRRYKLLDRKLTRQELDKLPFTYSDRIDNNGANMGIDEKDNIIVLDYGNVDMFLFIKELAPQAYKDMNKHEYE